MGADGLLVLIEPPIRDMLLELMRLLELVIVCLLWPGLAGVDFPALEDGLRTLREVLDREVVTRLDAALLDRDGAGVLAVNVFVGALGLLWAEIFGALDLV